MIQVEPCKGCGTIILLGEMMGLRAKCDPAAMDAQEAVAALLAGRELHRVTQVGGRPTNLSPARPAVLKALRMAEPGERPMVVGSHVCPQNASAPASGPTGPLGGTTAPKGGGRPPVPPKNRFSGQPTASSTPGSALGAVIQGSDTPCSLCGQPVPIDDPDGYVLIHLGATLIDAFHAGECPA
jgi:hypothetical protein